jgi:flagellar hook protein FlgE
MSLIGTLTSGVSALRAFTKDLEVIGNNIANVNTTGYKASSSTFADSFSNTLRGSAPSTSASSNQSSTQVGTGVNLEKISSNFTQGALTTTGMGTDLAVSGNGFFVVKNPADGSTFATRAGDFRIDDKGYLVTSQGYRVQGKAGSTTPADILLGTPPTGTQLQSFSIDASGNVVEFYSDGSSATTNQILLKNFKDPTALMKAGDNLFTGFAAAGVMNTSTLDATKDVPGTLGLGKIQSGQLELSNVDLTDQFAKLITTQRSFQASSHIITVSDQVLEDIVNLKR